MPPNEEDLRRQFERLQREIEKLRDLLTERDRQIVERDRRIADAEKQIADLERQLAGRRKNSTNSSKPPSLDFAVKPPPVHTRRNRSRRKPGGQKGHSGHHSRLVATEQVKRVIPILPAACKHCGEALSQSTEQIRTVGELQQSCTTQDEPGAGTCFQCRVSLEGIESRMLGFEHKHEKRRTAEHGTG